MRGIGKIILLITAGSFFFLVYVREQVALLDVSYQIDDRTEKLGQLSEEYRRLRFEVDQLKAPRLLEEKMQQHSMNLNLPQEIRVIRMPAEKELAQPPHYLAMNASFSTRFVNFVGRWIDVAQAKTDN